MSPPAAKIIPLCPSAQPEMPGARVIGVIDRSGEEPEVAYLDEPLTPTPELLKLSEPVRPTEVMRFSAPCQGERCSHFDGHDCKLVDRIVQLLPIVTLKLPPCQIRPECRWFAQSGKAACSRCPQVITQNQEPSDEMRAAALPPSANKAQP